MVPALELTDEEVLECLQKILKGVSVVPHTVPEYRVNNPHPAVSCFLLQVLFFILPSLLVLFVSTFLLNLSPLVILLIRRNWGVILLTRYPPMTTLLGWKLGRTSLERLQPVSFKPP
jgi:hypothetical protein